MQWQLYLPWRACGLIRVFITRGSSLSDCFWTQSGYPDSAACHRTETWFAFLDTVVNEINMRSSRECFQLAVEMEQVLLRAAKGKSINAELQQLATFYNDFNYDLLAA